MLFTAPAVAAIAPAAGPDVSSHNHPSGTSIDWRLVKASGAPFAFVKATEDVGYVNPYFTADWAGIAAAGLVRGAYHYARPRLPLTTASDQAKAAVGVTGTTHAVGDLPLALDLEDAGGLSPSDLVAWTHRFLDTVQYLTGRMPIIYTYPYFWQHAMANSTAFTRYPLWIADYNGGPAPSAPLVGGWTGWTFWQYSSNSSISGITGAVDASTFCCSPTVLASLSNGGVAAGAAPPPVPAPVADPANLAITYRYGSQTLLAGATGAAVAAMQQGLKITADGDFGPQTTAAVSAFQHSTQQPMTGVFGPTEWLLLFPRPVTPFGRFDGVTVGASASLLTGWAIDADTPAAVTVTVSVDGKALPATVASVSRPDVAAVYPGLGTLHGFAVAATVTDGIHTLCAVARNANGTPGRDASLGCKTLTFAHSPAGAIESAAQQLGVVRINGWRVDPDTTSSPALTLTVDGSPTTGTTVSTNRPDISLRYPGTGQLQGFSTTLTAPQGSHLICATAANASGTPGNDTPLGCRTVTVRHDPVGALDPPARQASGLQVTGWAVDPDSPAVLAVTVTVDGTALPAVPADLPGPVNSDYPDNGDRHAFSVTIPLPGNGTLTVCATASNAPGTTGVATSLGCVQVGSGFVPTNPVRLLDTRRGVGAPATAVPAGGTITLKVTGTHGVPTTGISAVALNLTATSATSTGYLTVSPGGQPRPATSNLNTTPGTTTANLVIVKTSPEGTITLYNSSGNVQLIADLTGYYTR